MTEKSLIEKVGVYACWYNQFIDLLDKDPHGSWGIQLASLPGWGFRGDWYFAIVNGSVSRSLGGRILDRLSTKLSEYERFTSGVGLPTRKIFYGPTVSGVQLDPEFHSWKFGTHVPLLDLFQIHKNALSRSSIPNYESFRKTLYTIAYQLTQKSPFVQKDYIKAQISRIPEQIKLLS